MLLIIIPVLLTIAFGPGVGQLYNREYRKGIILVGLSLGLLIAFSMWLGKAASLYIPTDLSTIDRNMLRSIIQDHIIPDHTGTFYTYEALLGFLWLYGVIDAFLGGARRRAHKQMPPTTTSTSL